MKQLDYTVFPSTEKTISVIEDAVYGGAHHYGILGCYGFDKEKGTKYGDASTKQFLRFVEKKDDGTMIPGLQSEQLVYVLLDRAIKLNKRFSSPQNEKMIAGLQMFLDACKERVEDRMKRDVMGELKK